eukprot:117805_1
MIRSFILQIKVPAEKIMHHTSNKHVRVYIRPQKRSRFVFVVGLLMVTIFYVVILVWKGGQRDESILKIATFKFVNPHHDNNKTFMYVSRMHRAIIIYEPNQLKYVKIFTHFLYNSWLYMLRVEKEYKSKYHLNNFTNIIDILVIIPTNYNLFHLLPNECVLINNTTDIQYQNMYNNSRNISKCILLYENKKRDDELHLFADYPFLYSIDCVLSLESHPIISNFYDYILKSDDDVFITPYFLYKFPSNKNEFIIGPGGYVWHNETTKQLLNMSNLLNLNHCLDKTKCFNFGSTWYSSPDLIVSVAKLTIKINKHLLYLFNTNQTRYNRWVDGWYKKVTSMYASELAINHIILASNNKYTLYKNTIMLDFFSQSKQYINKYNNNPIHIHVWQRSGIFNKHSWDRGEYKNILNISSFLSVTQYNKLPVANYCLAISKDLHLNISVNLFDIDIHSNQLQYFHNDKRHIDLIPNTAEKFNKCNLSNYFVTKYNQKEYGRFIQEGFISSKLIYYHVYKAAGTTIQNGLKSIIKDNIINLSQFEHNNQTIDKYIIWWNYLLNLYNKNITYLLNEIKP